MTTEPSDFRKGYGIPASASRVTDPLMALARHNAGAGPQCPQPGPHGSSPPREPLEIVLDDAPDGAPVPQRPRVPHDVHRPPLALAGGDALEPAVPLPLVEPHVVPAPEEPLVGGVLDNARLVAHDSRFLLLFRAFSRCSKGRFCQSALLVLNVVRQSGRTASHSSDLTHPNSNSWLTQTQKGPDRWKQRRQNLAMHIDAGQGYTISHLFCMPS
ncbi:hypothetical protein DFJ74DRAFT_650114 [Hyaloraphidium curvatum]|nr:hypothetical protein DFJ74DRAFT_650114 [Hyaloraphidium curvatum]